MKKLSIAPKLVSRKGSGRVNNDIPVDFMEYVIPKPDEIKRTEEMHTVPHEIKISEQIRYIHVSSTAIIAAHIMKARIWYRCLF